MAESISMERLEVHLLTKLDQKFHKYQNCHLSLIAPITVANSLIQGSLWYMLYMWAGDNKFLALLQKRWIGSSREAERM